MKKYSNPLMEIIRVEEDVVRTSSWADEVTKEFGEDWKWL